MQRLKKMRNVTLSAKYACAFLIYRIINEKFQQRRELIALKRRQFNA